MQSEKVMNSYSFLQKCYKSLLFLAKKRYELLLFLTKKCMNCYSFLQKGYTSLLFLAKNVWIVTFSGEKSMNCYQYFFLQKKGMNCYSFLQKCYTSLLFLAKNVWIVTFSCEKRYELLLFLRKRLKIIMQIRESNKPRR